MVKNRYCIKTRTKSSYGNFDPFIEKIMSHPNKIICSSTFFRPVCYMLYHPSDHIISMKTIDVIRTTELLLDFLISDRAFEQYNYPEQRICWCQLAARKEEEFNVLFESKNQSKSRELMLKAYEIVNVNEMKPIIISINNRVVDHFDGHHPWHGQNITNINDL